jgi:hypothetical protein
MPLAAVVLALTFVSATAAGAQQEGNAPGSDTVVPLSVAVTISRHQGDELVSSRPYVLAVTAGTGGGSVRMDDRVPVPIAPPRGTQADGLSGPVGFNYETVRTHIESSARYRGDGRFEVYVIVQESFLGGQESLVGGGDRSSADTSSVPYPPVSRSFGSENTLVLRDGQSRQYVAAADRRSGETIRVDVALTVLE